MTEEKYFFYICVCERCGYRWQTHKKKIPLACAKCKNKGWNKPRVYSGKYTNQTLLKREKSTWKYEYDSEDD